MKKLFFYILFFVFYSGLIVSAFPAQEAVGPKMILNERFFDFNEVNKGEIIEHSFIVFNKGDQPLHIQKVKPG